MFRLTRRAVDSGHYSVQPAVVAPKKENRGTRFQKKIGRVTIFGGGFPFGKGI
jgi:hypothetical protein